MNLTFRTRAGTFNHGVEVRGTHGFTIYYAPNVGPIKTVSNGIEVMELVELRPAL